MAVYRCPGCGETVRREAKRCRTCGLWFDLNHEPVPDEGQGKPENARKKEKKSAILAIAALAVFLAVAIAISIGNARMYNDAVKRWQREGAAKRRNKAAIIQAWDSATRSGG